MRPRSAAVLSSEAAPHSAMSPAPTSVTVAPTDVTVTLALPLVPSLVAVIVVAPAATPVTRPFPFTAATALLPLDQLIVRPDRGFPFASSGVAVSCSVWPTGTAADAGLTTTDAIEGCVHVT